MDDQNETPEPKEDRSSIGSKCIAAIPFLALTIGPPFANRLEPRIFGLPFLLAYLVFWVLVTPPFMLLANWLRRHR